MRDEVVVVVATVVGEEAECVRALSWRLERATVRRDRSLAAAVRKLRAATGGLEQRRFEAACNRRLVNTVEDAAVRARALRRRAGVRAAASELERVRRDGDVSVGELGGELARRVESLLARGHIGVQLSGIDVGELGRLVRLRRREVSLERARSAASDPGGSVLERP